MTTDEDFRLFVAARQAHLRRAAWLLTGEASLAEDLVQTALIKSWPHWHKLANEGAAESYVRKAMLTTYVSWWRRKWRTEVPGPVPDVQGRDSYAAVDLSSAVAPHCSPCPPGKEQPSSFATSRTSASSRPPTRSGAPSAP